MHPADDIPRAAALVRDARAILVLTGAGVSAESGVPTFRGQGGLWRDYRPESLATPEAFERDPRLVWEWYAWRRELVGRCAPNAAHDALARLARSRPGVRIATQNVDGLHSAAAAALGPHVGSDPAAPLELHGSILRARCTRCERRVPLEVPSSVDELPPRCETCGALLRPDVVWFGESLDPGVIGEAARLASAADICLVVGTSAVVHPAAGLASLARDAGGSVVEVNLEETPLTDAATVSIRSSAAAAVPEIVRLALSSARPSTSAP